MHRRPPAPAREASTLARAVAAGVIAGRALGSMLRTGSVTHTENAPGSLAMFDGAILAAPLFWIAIWVFG